MKYVRIVVMVSMMGLATFCGPCFSLVPDEDIDRLDLPVELKEKLKKTIKQTHEKSSVDALRRETDGGICGALGDLLRGGDPILHTLEQVRAEAKRRNLKINENLARAQKVIVGMNQCELALSLGFPDRVHRSMSRRKVDILYVYGDLFVFTTNGVVTSWQD